MANKGRIAFISIVLRHIDIVCLIPLYTLMKLINKCRVCIWNLHFQKHEEISLLCHYGTLSYAQCSTPGNCLIAIIMRRSKSEYRNALRFVKKTHRNI